MGASRWMAVALAVMGCTADGPKDDADPTGVDSDSEARPDDTDGGVLPDDHGLPSYDTVEPLVPFGSLTVDERDAVYHLPDDMVALVLVFHGTGGSSELAYSIDMVEVLNALIARDVGFVAIDSDDRRNGKFDDATPTATNPDWRRHVRVRDLLIDQGEIDADTPILALGYSAGGAFASYVGHAAVDAGWSLRAVAVHHSQGRSDAYGVPSNLPHLFIPARNDATVDSELQVDRYEAHVAAGRSGTLWWDEEQPLVPTRFARSPFISVDDSKDLARLAVRKDMFDLDGWRTFPADEIERRIDQFADAPDVEPTKPVRGILKVLLATHVFNGQHADDEAAWFTSKL